MEQGTIDPLISILRIVVSLILAFFIVGGFLSLLSYRAESFEEGLVFFGLSFALAIGILVLTK